MRLLFLVIIFFSTQSFSNDDTYRLATGDVVSVNVFNEPDLNLEEVKINDDGAISMPLIGQVDINGKTIAEVEKLLTALYEADYLVNPRITVTIDEFRPFYINGEVGKPGSYAYRNGLTVEIAVTIAGGFTERASKSNIYVTRENSKERNKVGLDEILYPGDLITVEESFF